MENNNNNYMATSNNQVANNNSKITDLVLQSVVKMTKNNGLVLPNGYNPSNALKAAYIKLAENNLLKTDQTALAQALLNMCIQGLNPAKNQCYFINYGGKVNLMRSYFGDRTACLASKLIKDIQANIIYEGDEVELNYDEGYLRVIHKTSWENMNNAIKGAYAFAVLPDGSKLYDIMTLERIKKSWAMSKNNANNKFQSTFSDDACKRTVIRHLVKNIFNQSTEDNPTIDSYCQTTNDEYDDNIIPNKEYKEDNTEAVRASQEASNDSQVPPMEEEPQKETITQASDFDM